MDRPEPRQGGQPVAFGLRGSLQHARRHLPADYLTRWRMTKAAERLRDRHTAIGEIAACSGYRSEAAFNRAFKRIEHITPGAYRRRNSRYALAPGTAASAGAGLWGAETRQ